jgi:hypothetical protein
VQPKADRPSPDDYWLTLVAHVFPQCLKARLDWSWPSEQANAKNEKTPTRTTVLLHFRRDEGDPLGAVASEMGAKRTIAGAQWNMGAILAPQSELFRHGVVQRRTGSVEAKDELVRTGGCRFLSMVYIPFTLF